MKRVVLFFSCILFLRGMLLAQDIEPGQQSQGYLNSKNMMVDHVTGIFHYKVPLFTLGSGEFRLSVSLDYSGKGVKENDVPGYVGYNWFLNTGGVVTRAIRGGIADEVLGRGYLWLDKFIEENSWNDFIEKVNKRELDGECDLFTVVLNGQAVNFVIRLNANGRIQAESLERSSVRIECESSDGYNIDGWVVTDEQGNRYIYKQKEWSCDIFREGAISFNGIRDKSYVSSWHLSRIEPQNQQPFVFTYYTDVREAEERQEYVCNQYHYSHSRLKYVYGKSMRERPFDFMKYKSKFKQEIKEAERYMEQYDLEMRLENDLYIFTRGHWVRNPSYELGAEMIKANAQVMGVLANIKQLTNASSNLIALLDDLIVRYGDNPSSHASNAVEALERAKACLTQCLSEEIEVNEREMSSETRFLVKSPVLQRIVHEGKSLDFEYDFERSQLKLENVKLIDAWGNLISRVLVEGMLRSLIFLDKNGDEVQSVRFDYYSSPSGGKYDSWGYWGRVHHESDIPDLDFLNALDASYAKGLSLKSITIPHGGKITVDYESNTVLGGQPFGGIRVKSLLVEDFKSDMRDSILYRYPSGGNPVFWNCFASELISYNGFNDRVFLSRLKYRGMPLVNTGNNGLLYPYVQEIVKGKGCKAYLFNVPNPWDYDKIFCAYWLLGLPLGVATYDDNGNLKQILKNKYSSDFSRVSSDELSRVIAGDYLVQGKRPFAYGKILKQVEAYEYYMNDSLISSYYYTQGRVLLYSDRFGNHWYEPYKDVYVPNFQLRSNVKVPADLRYGLLYGGKTLLVEQSEYRFETHVTDSVSESDFFIMTTGRPFQKVEFFYDNVSSPFHPTRVTRTDAVGESQTTVTTRVSGMGDAASPVFARMKEKNILSPVVKEVLLKGDTVQVEKVQVYEVLEAGDALHVVEGDSYAFYPGTSETMAFSVLSSPDAVLFTRGEANYRLERSLDYKQGKHSFLPVGTWDVSGSRACCYDCGYERVILDVKHATPRMVAAADLGKYQREELSQNVFNYSREYYTICSELHAFFQGLDLSSLPVWFREYYWGRGHQLVQDVLEVFSTWRPMEFDDYRKMVDSLYADNWQCLREFSGYYERLFQECPGLTCLPEVFDKLERLMGEEIVRNRSFFNCRILVYKPEYLTYSDTMRVTEFPSSGRLKLWVLSDGNLNSVSYRVEHRGGTSIENVKLASAPGYSLQEFDIDLNSYEEVSSLTVNAPFNPAAYIALLPGNVPFEATSYNRDGTVFCKFNQNGEMELNEYDAAGRLVRVKDEGGNVIKECEYNVVK